MAQAKPSFAPFARRMAAEGLPEIVIRTFRHYYSQLVAGHTGLIPEPEIRPVEMLPDMEALPAALAAVGESALPRAILLKLNGGLGTSMGLDRAKSLLTIKDNLTFLDIIARQALRSRVPLVLMSSYRTQADSLASLRAYPELWGEIPLDFLQHKVPKVVQADLSPARWPPDPALEWNPPGHGDIYTALFTSGLLDLLLANGYETAFVSNGDNLGAVMDTTLLGYFVSEQLPFLMEVADRTEADRKGGHLARRLDGQLILRESAQCPPEDMAAFQDVSHHRYFNTNNLWMNLGALQKAMAAGDNVLGLAMIRNSKTIDPRDATSTPVYQLETAMGAAIGLFEGAGAVRVPRTRFAPVKTTNDLLAIRSDAYVVTEDWRVVPNPTRRAGPLIVQLDPAYYRHLDDFEARFPAGAPSLVGCQRLQVEGDFRFGHNVTLRGNAVLINKTESQVVIEDQAVLEGTVVA